jgi:DNA repair protein RadD
MEEIVLRDYQEAALDHLYQYFTKHTGHPVVALPTGTGKSVIIGEFVRRALFWYPTTRILMLTHVKELIEQNMKALLKLWPTAPAGIYSAGLNRKEHRHNIIFAGIQSTYKKPSLFGHVDLILIDECHLVSPRGESMYGKLISKLTTKNPQLKVIGFSATPYRMKHGMLTDDDGIFTDIAFDLTGRKAFNWLIAQGWISPLVPRQTDEELDVSGVRMSGGEFILKDLQEHVDHEEITTRALAETVRLASGRNRWLIFASGITHSEHVAEALREQYGIPAAAVHSKLEETERDKVIRDFKRGNLKAIVNNNILTTGFDSPEIDCIVMLRPTASPGLWVQMLGRGTRPANGKKNCLVLDFAGNTKRLGPINDPVLPRKRGRGAPGVAPVRLCETCGCYSHASARFCENPECGAEFPKNIRITAQASLQEIIAGVTPEINSFDVDMVVYTIHHKAGKPDSMRVNYHCGLRRFSEYICLDHGGYATRVAKQWWEMRSPWGVPPDVKSGMAAVDYLKTPKKIKVVEGKRYPEICGYEFD